MREAATGNNRSPTVDSRVDCATETSTWDEMPCAGTASTEQNRNRPRRRSWWSWFGRCQRAPIDSSDCGFRVSSSRRRQWHWSSVATQTTSDPTTNQPSNTNNNMAAIHSNNRIIVRNLVCAGGVGRLQKVNIQCKQVRSRLIATTWPSLHWLQAVQRIDNKIDVLVYQCLHRLAPVYLSVDLQSIKNLLSRQRLRSWSSDTLAVSTSNLSTVGDRAFPIVAARVWNTLSPDVRSSSSLSTFKRRLKTELCSRSFPNWCDCVNFRYICKVASQLWLMPP